MATATKQHDYIKQLEQRITALENPASFNKAVKIMAAETKQALNKPPTQFSNAAATVAAVGTILFLN
jgi:hypothetical protein